MLICLFELGSHQLFEQTRLDVEDISTHWSILRQEFEIIQPFLHGRDVVINTLLNANTGRG